MKKIVFTLCLFFISQIVSAQLFTEDASITLPGVHNSSIDWGDYDNDGDLDLILTGTDNASACICKIYENDGSGGFTLLTSISPGLRESSVKWGDYDNDGDLDFVVMGTDGFVIMGKLYNNGGVGSFTHESSVSLLQAYQSSAAWGDYDNDGDLDLIMSGHNGSAPESKIYQNDGAGDFSDAGISLTNFQESAVAWGDYDNDGDIDFIIAGNDPGNNKLSIIYENDGKGNFSDAGISLSGIKEGAVAWGDYDNDGDLDILLGGNGVCRLYNNNGAGGFTNSGNSFANFFQGSLAWGDYNNDGYLDILLNGTYYDGTWQKTAKVYTNDQTGGFVEETGISLTGVNRGTANWCDYDNDGDLDIHITGWDGSTAINKIYTNNEADSNHAPTAPTNLIRTTENGNTVLSWEAATDDSTVTEALTYNIYLGTVSSGVDIISPMSNLNNGFRKIAALGNAQADTFFILKGLECGQSFYWSVQAIDHTLAGGNFSSEQNFTIPSAPALTMVTPVDISCHGLTDGQLSYTATGGAGILKFMVSSDTNTTGNFNGLSAGNYYLTLTDENKCTTFGTMNTITEPPLLSITNKAYTSITCTGLNDGALAYSATGGTLPLNYNIGSDTNQAGGFSSLLAGSYTLTITDANNCKAYGTSVNITEPPLLSITAENATDITCAGLNDGALAYSATGGTLPLTYDIGAGAQDTAFFDMITAGDYTLTVSDMNDCKAMGTSQTIDEPGPVEAQAGNDQEICAGESVTLQGSGGQTYDWSGGITDGTVFSPNTTTAYTLTVTDADGCKGTDQLTITVKPLPELKLSASEDTILRSASTLTLTASGADQYTWSDSALSGASAQVSPTVNTSYSVTGTGENGCQAVATAAIVVLDDAGTSETAGSQVKIYPNPVSNGQLHIDAEKPPGPVCVYNIHGEEVLTIQNPDQNLDMSGLKAGEYIVSIKIGDAWINKKIIVLQ